MTYLEIVNKVLRRLRETEVTSLNETPYSKLVAELVNVVKREVEDAWNWDALRTTFTITTTQGLFNYVLEDSGTRFRVLDMYNDTTDVAMQYRSTHWFDRAYQAGNPTESAPTYYNFNGVDANGDSQVDIYPPPDKAYSLRLNIVYPQPDLENAADVIQVNPQLVIEGTIARAISERGEDGGFMEQEQRYRAMAADLIAIEAHRRPDEIMWAAK